MTVRSASPLCIWAMAVLMSGSDTRCVIMPARSIRPARHGAQGQEANSLSCSTIRTRDSGDWLIGCAFRVVTPASR